jgi:chemotaxis protein histidine kinase CheA
MMHHDRSGEDPRTYVEQMLRSAHSIKAGAGFTRRRKIEHPAHFIETSLENVRDGRISATPEAIDTLLSATLSHRWGRSDGCSTLMPDVYTLPDEHGANELMPPVPTTHCGAGPADRIIQRSMRLENLLMEQCS